jgi:hypothetical protein
MLPGASRAAQARFAARPDTLHREDTCWPRRVPTGIRVVLLPKNAHHPATSPKGGAGGCALSNEELPVSSLPGIAAPLETASWQPSSVNRVCLPWLLEK